MPPPQTVINWLNKHFPKPQVDPEWLNDCCEWLTGDQGLSPVTAFADFIAALRAQLLQSDLADSMLHGTGLEPGIVGATTTLRGPPVLVQIVDITEIGSSAFQLEQTRAAREERMKAGEGNVEGEEEGDVEVEGEGPMPKYPRGTLRFQLSDGATVFDAMEYRPLTTLTLGNTPLGFKMQLKGTHFQKGMAFLEPNTVELLGEKTADLDENRERVFRRGLKVRLGRPLSPEPSGNADGAAVEMRSPLREISPPPVPQYPQHDDDIGMEPRRRLPAGSSVSNAAPSGLVGNGPRPMHSLPSHAPGSNISASQSSKASTTSAYFNTSTNASTTATGSGTRSTKSKEERDRLIALALQESTITAPTTRQLASRTVSPSQRSATLVGDTTYGEERDPSFDFDLLDQFENDENAPPPASSSSNLAKGKGPAVSSLQPPLGLGSSKTVAPPPPPRPAQRASSPDYFMDDDYELDEAALAQLNEIEKASALGGTTSQQPSHLVGPSISGPNAKQTPGHVIEIEDSDEEMLEADDKENQPVQTRSVRRRLIREEDEDEEVEILPPGPSQRGGRPARKPIPEDVISLSDSD